MIHNFELVPIESRSELRSAETHWRESLKTRVATAERKAKPRVPRARKRFLAALIGVCVLGAAFLHNANATGADTAAVYVDGATELLHVCSTGFTSPELIMQACSYSYTIYGTANTRNIGNAVSYTVTGPDFSWNPDAGICVLVDYYSTGDDDEQLHLLVDCRQDTIFANNFETL